MGNQLTTDNNATISQSSNTIPQEHLESYPFTWNFRTTTYLSQYECFYGNQSQLARNNNVHPSLVEPRIDQLKSEYNYNRYNYLIIAKPILK